jgi:hypothetical protein
MLPPKPNYIPFDQETHLGPSPWNRDVHKVKEWEEAHGHDLRLKCYPEFNCKVIEEYSYWRGYIDGFKNNTYDVWGS